MTCENWPLLADTNIPSYVQIYDIVLQLIQDGALKEGDYLPGENYLAAHWNVSRSTVRTAVRKLQEDGFLYKMQGKRTTVATRTSQFDNGLQWLFNPCIKNCILPITAVNVVPSLQQCGKYLAEKLGYKETAGVMVKMQTGYYSNEWKVASTFLLFHSSMLEKWNISLYDEDTLKELISQKIYQYAIRSRIELTAMATNKEVIEIPGGSNAVIIEEVLIGTNDEPIAYCKHWMNANWYRFAIDRKSM